MSMPAAQSIMTRRVTEQEQGELQGALQSMRSITFIIGPVIFLQTFRWFIDPKHGTPVPCAPFFLAAILLGIAATMSTRLKVADAKDVSSPAPSTEPETMLQARFHRASPNRRRCNTVQTGVIGPESSRAQNFCSR